MGKKIEERQVDGETYKFGQFGARESTKMAWELTSYIGPSLGALISSLKGDKKLLDVDTKDVDFGMALDKLFVKVTPEKMEKIIEKLFSQVIYVAADDKQGGQLSKIWDVHFQGRGSHMINVLKTAMEVQFGNFFDGQGGLNALLS